MEHVKQKNRPSTLNQPLDAVIFLSFKNTIASQRFAEGRAVGNHAGSIQPTGFNQSQNILAIAGMNAAGFEGQVFAVHLMQK